MSEVHVAILLDRSGSMQSIKRATINNFNEQIQTIKDNAAKTGIDTYVSYYTFGGDAPTEEFFEEAADQLIELDDNSYIPRGSTPLHACIKLAIDRIREVVGVGSDDLISQCNDIMTGNDTTVLFIILTDGVDNMSTSEDKSYVAEFIQTLTDSGRWTFTYAGANQNVQKLVEEFHFRPENVVSYAATDMGMSAHTSALTRGLDTYYAARSVAADTFNATDVSFYDNKDEEQK